MRLGPCIGIFLWLLEWAQVEKEQSLSSSCANGWIIFLISLRYGISQILNLWEFLGLTLCLSLSSCPLLGHTQVSRFIKSISSFLNLKQTRYKFTCYLLSFRVSSWLILCPSFFDVCYGKVFTGFKLLLIIKHSVIFCTTTKMG